MEWDTFKLFFHLGERNAEVFLRLSADGIRAQLVEKWSAYREDLVAILDRALSGSPPRRIQVPATPIAGPNGERLLSIHGALEFAVPLGWRASQQPEGHRRVTDPDEEMMIELSYLSLPPLPPDAPTVTERLRQLVNDSEHRASSTPIAAFVRDDVSFGWSEYTFDSNDTKRPTAPRRPARGRWLIASNEWTQALVTACWWEAHAAVAEAAWNAVVASLQLSGRVVAVETPSAEA